ncbi:hypothetical protein Hanom_Chr13g01195481 [Helianthus anomalus]
MCLLYVNVSYRTLDFSLLCGDHSESLRLSISTGPTVSVISDVVESHCSLTESFRVVNVWNMDLLSGSAGVVMDRDSWIHL